MVMAAGIVTLLILSLPGIAVSQVSPATVNLGTSGDFVLIGETKISSTGTTKITGDIGVSPVAATYITGFGLIMDVSNTYSTSSLITGKVYAADYTYPTPTKMTTAIGNMETAYTNAAGRTLPDYSELYLPYSSNVTLEVYNLIGMKVGELVNQEQAAGYYTVDFNSNSLNKSISSGVYFYKINAVSNTAGDNFSSIKKMILLK